MDTTVTLAGNCTKDPELRFTTGGHAVTSVNIACNKRVKDADGTWKDDDPIFVTVTCWRQLGENAAASLKKGDRVIVCGDLKVRTYERPDGTKGSSLELTAEDIACSFKWATATVERTHRASSSNGGGAGPFAPEPDIF